MRATEITCTDCRNDVTFTVHPHRPPSIIVGTHLSETETYDVEGGNVVAYCPAPHWHIDDDTCGNWLVFRDAGR